MRDFEPFGWECSRPGPGILPRVRSGEARRSGTPNKKWLSSRSRFWRQKRLYARVQAQRMLFVVMPLAPCKGLVIRRRQQALRVEIRPLRSQGLSMTIKVGMWNHGILPEYPGTRLGREMRFKNYEANLFASCKSDGVGTM